MTPEKVDIIAVDQKREITLSDSQRKTGIIRWIILFNHADFFKPV
jgi:hypothetical protein